MGIEVHPGSEPSFLFLPGKPEQSVLKRFQKIVTVNRKRKDKCIAVLLLQFFKPFFRTIFINLGPDDYMLFLSQLLAVLREFRGEDIISIQIIIVRKIYKIAKPLCPGNMAEELADIRCRMAGTNVVLTEFSTVSHYADMKRWLEEMLDAGYVPVIAHAERYRCLYQSEERLRKLRDMGVPVQLNAGGILGREGAPVRRFCLRVLQEGIADFIASDAHSMDGRPVEMAACRKKVQRRFGKEKADWWFCGAQEKLFKEAGASSQIQ